MKYYEKEIIREQERELLELKIISKILQIPRQRQF